MSTPSFFDKVQTSFAELKDGKAPQCTRQPLMWSIAVSSTLFLHQKYSVKARMSRVVDATCLSFLFTALTGFAVCNSMAKIEKERKMAMLEQGMNLQGIKKGKPKEEKKL